jgi:formylglycine-generating enzyme
LSHFGAGKDPIRAGLECFEGAADITDVPKALQVARTGKALAPPLWEIEFRLLELLAKETGICRAAIHHDSRVIEDLNMDSLELVELILSIEEEFNVGIPDDLARLPFVSGSVTVGNLAEIIKDQWGKPRHDRRCWVEPRLVSRQPVNTPFTQMAGQASEDERQGQLLDRLGLNEQGVPLFRRRMDGMRCVLVPGAEVEIGTDAAEAREDSHPLHRATLVQFLIDVEPVSTSAFARFLNSIGEVSPETIFQWCGVTDDDRRCRHFQLEGTWGNWRPRAGAEQQPMVLVSWYGAAAYSLWVNRRDWRNYKTRSMLPSEAQWEYAARGATWKTFPWGDAFGNDRALVATHVARAKYGDLLPLADTHVSLGVSPFGLLHMAGNVWNWCADWYSPKFYQSAAASRRNPMNTRASGIRTERGGSWIGPAELAQSSYRRGRPPHARGRCLGFRCISTPHGRH